MEFCVWNVKALSDQRLHEFIPLLQLDSIDKTTPTSRQNRDKDSLVNQLKDLDSVTKSLQRDYATLTDVRVLFDTVIEEYPETKERLKQNADIVFDAVFERAVLSVLSGRVDLSSE